MKRNCLNLFVCLLLLAFECVHSASNDANLETCNDEKQFKTLIKTKPNLLVLFSKSSKFNLIFFGILSEIHIYDLLKFEIVDLYNFIRLKNRALISKFLSF